MGFWRSLFNGGTDRPRVTNRGVLEEHYALHDRIENLYKHRKESAAVQAAAMEECYAQIAISHAFKEALLAEFKSQGESHPTMVSHTGYERLCVMLKETGRLAECARTAEQARQQGWCGNWARFIAPKTNRKI